MPTMNWMPQNWMIIGLVSLLVVLLLIFLFVFFKKNPKWILERLGASDKFQALKFLGLSMGGILFVIQIAISSDVNQNAEQGLRQERLKNAIEHLGNLSDAVSLGGAYELFHLAEDNQELRRTAFDILCAHIRRRTRNEAYRGEYWSEPSEEIQSLLILLFVQKHEVFKSLRIDLQKSWLNGADLAGARLKNVVLNNAHLQGANLEKAQLQKARLREAHLQGAWLREAHLQGARLGEAHLQGAWLGEAHLQRAWLQEAHLQGAWLQEAHLQGAWLGGTNLQEAYLVKANLQGVVSSDGELLYEFAERMRKGIDRQSDLSNVVFAGGLTKEKVDTIVKSWMKEKVGQFRTKLQRHIDKPANHKLPENSGAITGAYTKEEAERWIAEYKEAISEVQKTANGY